MGRRVLVILVILFHKQQGNNGTRNGYFFGPFKWGVEFVQIVVAGYYVVS